MSAEEQKEPQQADAADPADPTTPVEDSDAGFGTEAAVRMAERVDELEAELLRVRAEMENQRKRSLRDIEQARRFGAERLLGELLQVADSLERGLQAAEQDGVTIDTLKEGKALTLSQLGKVFASQGVVEEDPTGKPFDPELHQAMAMQPSAEHPEGTVLHVVQKGYRLHDRLLRPAMVVVSKSAQ
jgi:molecular chaperone GrpE